ncbi:uncharacterized protein LOC130014652 [Mercurialis annua]|uniref:uncharacterized protein LOC130014652 n=1 Tax=Mercurialis annua TaxID=3986 RepID=UPI0024AEFB7B|nr:uncharacterized protein LOC130014652 [Mercurialis annua]
MAVSFEQVGYFPFLLLFHHETFSTEAQSFSIQPGSQVFTADQPGPSSNLKEDPFVNYVVLPIKRRVSYPFTYRAKVHRLQDLAAKLRDKRRRLEDSVSDVERNGEDVYEDVRNWLSHSETAIQEAEVLVNAQDEAAKKRCFVGLCPDLNARYKLSKKAEEKASAVEQLEQQEADLRLRPISCRPRPQQHVDPSVVHSEQLESRLSVRKQVMEALKDPNLNRVGVWGMGGVGKSTLAKQLHGLALEEKLFDDVVFVAVSEKPELGEIQKKIASVLDVKFDVEDSLVQARQLFKRIKGKKILIILDDIWKEIDLLEIGIPTGADGKDCKILLTSRDKRVLRDMDAQKEFMLQVLTQEEACSMFARTVPHAKDPDFDAIAIEVVQKCAGLPLLIKLVAGDLRDCKKLGMWKEKLKQLSNFKDEEIDSKVHESLKSSYNKLIGDEIKSFFLLCALGGQSNIHIEFLLRYCIGLDLFNGRPTVVDARNRANDLINKLQDRCLLLEGDMEGYVKMHDIILDAALSIACTEKHAYICRSNLTELPNKDCTKISLPFCDFQNFTGSHSETFKFECQNAELLLLLTEDISLEVSDSFFEGVKKLKVLDFTGMRMGCLPSSIKSLADLQTLCLDSCHLDELSVIGELKQLKVLSFVDAYMVELPKEIEQLTRLKILDLSNCSKLKVIPANVFSKLTMLEELYMRNFIHWEADGNASLEELEHLSHLTTLEMQVLDLEMIPKYFFFNFKGLQNYRIVIGDVWGSGVNSDCSRIFKLKFRTSIYSKQGVLKLLKESDDLYLDEVWGIESVLYDLDGDGFCQLKHLHVQNDPTIQHIVNSTKSSSCPAFPILQSLFLKNLSSLETLCNGRLTAMSFSKLKDLKIKNCERLTTLFLLCCNNEEESVNVELTQLYSLKLNNLPMLRSLCNKTKVPLESLTVDDPALQEGVSSEGEPLSLFSGLVSLPNLENLTIKSVCCKKIWQDHLSITSLNLTSLAVESCHNLRNLFTSSMVKSLSQLKHIQIRDCDFIEEIVVTGDSVDETEKTARICFPKLERLTLARLPKLSRFCTGHPIEFQSLEELVINKCSGLNTFVAGTQQVNLKANNNSETQFLFNGMVGFPKLETLGLVDIKNLENIWHTELMPNSFSKLKVLVIHDCHKLLTVFPPHDLSRFHTLERLRIHYCDSLQEIFQFIESNAEEDTDVVVEFKLRELQISFLKKLKTIWSNNPPTSFTFQELQSVEVESCWDMKSIFPTSIATGLSQLQNLTIERCGKVEGIVAKSESAGSDPNFKFPQLTSLVLDRLLNLKGFYPERHRAVEWPKLKCLKLIQCNSAMMFGSEEEAYGDGGGDNKEYVSFQPFFMFEKLNRNLEQLTLHHSDLLRIQIGQSLANCFSKLKVLTLKDLMPESVTVLFGFLKTLYNLEELVVDHSSLEELFSDEDAVYVPLKRMTISDASDLKQIWKQDAVLKPVTQYLESLTIDSCYSLSKIVQSTSSFRNLGALEVNHCNNLKSLFTVSTAKTMVNLTQMSLWECSMMTEVVENDGDETEDEVVFNKLQTLQLQILQCLTSFTRGNHAFSFPLLEEVLVVECPQMEIFSTGVLSTPKLQSVVGKFKDSPDDQFWEGTLNATISYLFVERLLPLGDESRVKVSKFPALKEHWHDRNLGRRFLSVETLIVDRCASFPKALSANLLHSLNKLTSLEVRDCGSMEEVFDLEGMSADEGRVGLLPRLYEIHLIDLPMLRSLWNKNPTNFLDLRNLTVLKVENCNSLKYAFTQSESLFLVQLQAVHLKNCHMIEGVLSEIICPSLKKISVHDCPNLKIRLENEQLDIDNNAHVDCLKVAFPNLVALGVEWNIVKEIWSGRSGIPFLGRLKGIGLTNFPGEQAVLPSNFLQTLRVLEQLVLSDASFEEITIDEVDVGDQFLAHLRAVKLCKLPNLKHLIKQNSRIALVIEQLEILKVVECGRLKVLVSPLVSFQYLTVLQVSKCHGLINLMTPATARSLVQLERMVINKCEMIKEIISSEADEVEDEIHLSRLEYFELSGLPRLTSFCSGRFTFNFPSLVEVIIRECPKMETFAQGDVTTSKLWRVQTGKHKYEWEWESNLNDTIETMSMQMSAGTTS